VIVSSQVVGPTDTLSHSQQSQNWPPRDLSHQLIHPTNNHPSRSNYCTLAQGPQAICLACSRDDCIQSQPSSISMLHKMTSSWVSNSHCLVSSIGHLNALHYDADVISRDGSASSRSLRVLPAYNVQPSWAWSIRDARLQLQPDKGAR